MTPLLTLNLLGGVDLLDRDRSLVLPKSRKGLALFLYLACTRRAHTREALADLLWDAASTKQSLSNLRTVLSRLPTPLREQIVLQHDNVAVDPTALQVDVWVLEEPLAALSPPLSPQGAEQASRVLQRYRGDFLAGFAVEDAPRFADWVLLTRERLRQVAWQGFERLTTDALATGAYEQGIALATQWLALEPHDEPMHMLLLRLFAAQGAPHRVRTHYANYLHDLRTEYQLAPSAELQECYARLTQPDQLMRTPPRLRPNLPFFPTSFVGREVELAQLQTLLRDPHVQLITITGTGGIGKTRLAVAAVAQLPEETTPPLCFVPLADVAPTTAQPVIDPVIGAIGDALQLTLDPQRPALAQLIGHFQQHAALLLLDNFEHLMASAAQITALLTAVPQLTMLITSRTRLQLRQEWSLPLTGLHVPAEDEAQHGEADDSAITLFIERARQHDPTFDATAHQQTMRAVHRICQLVDGLPLAIELAAAWVALLTPTAILAELEESLDLLATTSPSVPTRQQTMRAVFEGSWQTLDEEARVAFVGLAVFHGGFTREAAQAVLSLSLRGLQTLVNKSLLHVNQSRERYELHELLRYYALEKLAADPAYAAHVQLRHSHYYCHWLQRHEAALKGAGTVEQLRRIDGELENMHAAWIWALDHGHHQLLVDTVNCFFTYYLIRNRDPAGNALVERALADLQANDVKESERTLLEHLRIKLTIWLARFQLRMGHLPSAHEQIGQLLHGLAQLPLAQVALQRERADALLLLGHILYATDLAGADRAYGEAEQLFAHLGDEWNRANALMALGAAAQDLGDLVRAGHYYETCVALRRRLDGPRALGEALLRLADHRQEQLRLSEAHRLVEEAMAIFQRLTDQRWQAHSYGQLGFIALYRCDYANCIAHCDRAIDLLTQLERDHETVHWLYYAATAHFCLDDDAKVEHYLAKCTAVAERFAQHLWRALCTFLTGCRLLGQGQYENALATLQAAEVQLGDRLETSYVWAAASYVYWQLADYAAAQRLVVRALAAAQMNASVQTVGLALPAAALLLQQQGVDPERVAQIYRLAERLPYVGNSPFFWRMAGQQLVVPVQRLGSAEAGLARDSLPDLWTVAREVQAQLSE